MGVDPVSDYFVDNGTAIYFDKYLPSHLENALQLGVLIGGASAYLHARYPNLFLVDVDTWSGPVYSGPTHIIGVKDYKAYWKDVEQLYLDVAKHWTNHKFYKCTSDKFFADLVFRSSHVTFDFIYIDADHDKEPALLDITNSWAHLAIGGLMAIDDAQMISVREAWLTWYSRMAGLAKFTVLQDGYLDGTNSSQIWVRKD